MEPLKSLLFNLEIERKSKEFQEAEHESLNSSFGPKKSGFGYANWGTHDIGFESPEDIQYYQDKQSNPAVY